MKYSKKYIVYSEKGICSGSGSSKSGMTSQFVFVPDHFQHDTIEEAMEYCDNNDFVTEIYVKSE